MVFGLRNGGNALTHVTMMAVTTLSTLTYINVVHQTASLAACQLHSLHVLDFKKIYFFVSGKNAFPGQ